MIKPIKQVTSILKMLVLIAFVPCHTVSYAEDIPDLPGTVHIPVKGGSPQSSSSSATFTPVHTEDLSFTGKMKPLSLDGMIVNPLKRAARAETTDNPITEIKLNKAILSLTNPELRKRDIAMGVGILGLTGLCLAYVPAAEGSNWTNDFWNPCSATSMSCYALQYIDPHGGKIVDDSIAGVKIDLGIAYGLYIPFRLAELAELYTPDTANVNAIKRKRGWVFRILNGVAEVGVLASAGIIGYVSGSGYYHDLTSGGWTAKEILPLAVPLGIFFRGRKHLPL